jgi:hypothetical protein
MEPELRQFIRKGRSAKLPGGLGLSGRPPARETSWNLTRPEAFMYGRVGPTPLPNKHNGRPGSHGTPAIGVPFFLAVAFTG